MTRKIKNLYHLMVAVAANIYYGFPSRKLTVVGVTGTDGKTTTSSILYHILSESGKKTALTSTVGAFINGKKYDLPFHVTTPSSFGIQKYIKKAVDSGCEYLVLEITSHGLDQYRDWGISYKAGILTNVSHEHLDYHKNYERYLKAKLRLLYRSEICVLNRDDESFKFISKIRDQKSKYFQRKKIITFGLEKNSDMNPYKFPFKTQLIGEFSQYNCLAAISVAKELGLGDEEINKSLVSFTTPLGRQNIVYDKKFKIIVDFAHTPNAFLQILPAVRGITKKRVIHVFGAAGLRDNSKRPLMGTASAQFADVVILTAEDPRTEKIETINQQIKSGIKDSEILIKQERLFEINNRKDAIAFAIKIAQKDDTILLTGKGHEKSMNYGNGEEPWDEIKIVHELCNKYVS